MCSVCRLNYDQAQEVIDDIEIEETKRPAVHGGYTWQQIKDDIKLLYEVCGKVRMGRLTGGAMTISKTKMSFRFNMQCLFVFVYPYSLNLPGHEELILKNPNETLITPQ